MIKNMIFNEIQHKNKDYLTKHLAEIEHTKTAQF